MKAPVNRSESIHLIVFLIGVITMISSVAMVVEYPDAAVYWIAGGGVVAVLAMISQAYSWYKNGTL